jgi:hypothetical protein
VLSESIVLERAVVHAVVRQRIGFDKASGLFLYEDVSPIATGENLITNAGLIAMHKQCYDTSSLLTNGFNYIGLSDDTLTETSSSTTLSNEITSNGLGRAQGTVTLPTGSGNQTTIAHTFIASGTQSVKKTALFTASSSGTMQHVIQLDTTLVPVNGQNLVITFTLTLG